MSRQTGLGTLEAEAAAISGHLFFASQDLVGHIRLHCASAVPPGYFSVFLFFFFFFSIWLFAGICSAGPHNVFP